MTRDRENMEWLNEYPALKQVDKNNPFTVPDGYFNELGEHIKATIMLNDLKGKMALDGFSMPENYFETLNTNIQSRINIEKAIGDNSNFTVPENYFTELTNNINSRINIEKAVGRDMGFAVPENYFEQLNNQINSRIFVEEALTETADNFTVPKNYFNKLNKDILNKTVNQDIAKRKGAVIRFMSSTAFKYATAACLTVMVGAGVLVKQVFSPEAVHERSFLHKELTNVSADDIQDYLELQADDTQHSVTSSTAPVDDPNLEAALQDYANSTQK